MSPKFVTKNMEFTSSFFNHTNLHGRGIPRYFWRQDCICICYGPLNSESPMQSVARPGKVVIKFGEGKIAQVYHHCSGHLNHLQPAHMCKALAKGRKRLEHFDWNVYSCPWVLLVASFPYLEDLKAYLSYHQQPSATSWEKTEMSCLYNSQNPLDQGLKVRFKMQKSAFAQDMQCCNLRLNFNYLSYLLWCSI